MTRLSHTPCDQRSTAGQALVELALVLGVLLLVILGGMDLLQSAMAHYTVAQAVRAAAHQAALVGGPDGQNGSWGTSTPPSGTIASTAQLVLDSGLGTNAAYASISVSCPRQPCRRYDPITVRLVYQAPVWAPFPGALASVSVDQRATRLAEKDGQ